MTPLPDPVEDEEVDLQPNASHTHKIEMALKHSEDALKVNERSREASQAQHAMEVNGLQATIKAKDLQIADWVKLQKRHESLNKKYHEKRRVHEAYVAETTNKLTHKDLIISKRDGTIARLKGERDELRGELAAAQVLLKASTTPGVAEMQVMKEQLDAVTKEKEALEKRVASHTHDFEFTRNQYQIASTAAAERAGEVKELQDQVEELKKKASGEVARVKEFNRAHMDNVNLERVQEVEATLVERDELLRKREEEIRELKKGRGVATRSSSAQPRSPRPGSSRAGSPAPGNLGFQSRGGSSLRFSRE